MAKNIVIAIFIVLFIVMPYTHFKAYKHGRVTMNKEDLKVMTKRSFVLNGKITHETIKRYFDVCEVCHMEGI